MFWKQKFDSQFGFMGEFWEKWADGSLPEIGGISEDVKNFIELEIIEEIINDIAEPKLNDSVTEDIICGYIKVIKQQLRNKYL